MYITFIKQTRGTDNLFQALLKDPLSNPDIKDTKANVVTYDVPIDIAKNYAKKHLKEKIQMIPNLYKPVPKEEIPNHYKSFEIPKKTNPNKKRKIDAPDLMLKNAQSNAKYILEEYLNIIPNEAAHAYVKNRSNVTANKKHSENKSNWFLKLDLKDFFPSHNEEYIRNMLELIYPFPFIDTKDIDHLIELALLNDSLPQGTPLSPTLTNILMIPIDHAIFSTLKEEEQFFVYTRYADDIIISSKKHFDPKKITDKIKDVLHTFDTPFKINEEKTRYGSVAGRNWNLGIMLNKDHKLTIGHEKNQKLRAMLFQYGTDNIKNKNRWEISKIQKSMGLISYYKSIEPDYVNHVLNKYSKKFDTDIFKHMIKSIS